MSQPGNVILTTLHDIATAPGVWYPKPYADNRGVPRDELDKALERLRMLGLVELTPWEAPHGQGYRLTAHGRRVLYSQSLQSQLVNGTLPAAAPEPEAAPEAAWGEKGANPYERGEAIRAGLMSKTRPTITYVLMGLNLAVFLLGLALVFPNTDAMTAVLMGTTTKIPIWTGALTPNSLIQGQWWRLLTSCFVHFGLLHIGVNMYSLWILGPLSEKAWGRWRFLALYLISGLGGRCAMAFSMAIGWERAGAGAGASGALWGLMAAFGIWVFLNRHSLGKNLSSTWLRQIGLCVVINLFLTFSISYLSKSGHLGGGLFGLVAAVLLNEQRFSGGLRRWMATAGAVLLPVIAVVAALSVQPKGPFNGVGVGQGDFEDLLDDGLDAVNKTDQQFHDRIIPLLQKPWEQRPGPEVTTAQGLIQDLRTRLSQSGAALERFGKASGNREEQIRLALLEIIHEQNELYKLALRQLEKGQDWTPKDQKDLEEQGQALKRTRDEWKRLQGT
jgi:membrane associated rhomboid family serine protease